MKREYHIEKDLKGQYLWIDRENVWGEAYEENIFRKQKISRLIHFYETENMGDVHLVYSLEYRRNFIEMLKNGRMRCPQIESLMKSIVHVMQMMDEYLLDPSNLVIEMDFIYENNKEWDFLYIPGYQEDFWKQMEKLSEVWLNYIDYADEKAVLWAYTFYEKVHGGECSVDMFDEIMRMDKKLMEKQSDIVTVDEAEKITDKDIINKETFWRRIKNKIRIRKEKNRSAKKTKFDFFREDSDLEVTCPALKMTEVYETPEKKNLMLIPMGETATEIIRFEKIPALVGRTPGEVDICIWDLRISRIHARIDYKNGQVVIVDMNSSNGTCRNGERLKAGEAYALHAGDIIKLADLEFICQWCA